MIVTNVKVSEFFGTTFPTKFLTFAEICMYVFVSMYLFRHHEKEWEP